MPTYEYRCGSCNHQFEVFAKMSDPAPERCEACGATDLTKVLFPVAVHYKGSGFYSTDYSGSRASGSSDSGASKDAGGGESKPTTSSSESSSSSGSGTASSGSSSDA